ncbi:13E12 repeat family protein [Kribbella sp. NBC_00709]|uniref:DUF222 domain-containing protein n=1 Tax=Kribbella sp. NBC_00709 TaxID=2975972 RepID=UPI002E2843AE|nr:DUF222 domain-containing protein [Kribbella sp. NBC_00709]
MFEGDLDELAPADLLAAASEFVQIQERAAVRMLEAALAFADRNAVVSGEPLPGCERIQVYGGVGCPGVAEFAPIEFGAVMRMSTGAAASFIGEALALRHRLPRIWAAVLAGNAVPWRARKIAHACLSLSLEAAAIVDRRVVGIVDTVTPGRLATIVTAAVWQAEPELAKAQAEAAARSRGVFVAPSDVHGTKRFWVRAAAGDVIRFDATIDDLARALKTLGDTDDLDQRRAKAIGWIADPAAAHQLIEVARHLASDLARTQPTHLATSGNRAEPAPDPPQTLRPPQAEPDDWADPDTPAADTAAPSMGNADDGMDAFSRRMLAGELPARLAAIKQDAHSNGLGAGSGRRTRHTLFVHLTDQTLATGTGVLRVEELGPLLASQLSELLGHDQVVIKPVIDLHDQVSVHCYEIPDRIRERVRLQHPVDMFPYSGAEATTRMDQDHITPYDRTGPPGQTSTHNLIPQGRLHHRAKTFGGWRSRRLPTGGIEWISPHGFQFQVDHTGTHPVPRTTGGGVDVTTG